MVCTHRNQSSQKDKTLPDKYRKNKHDYKLNKCLKSLFKAKNWKSEKSTMDNLLKEIKVKSQRDRPKQKSEATVHGQKDDKRVTVDEK